MNIPIYVTRPLGSEKRRGYFSVDHRFVLACGAIITFNIIGWGIYGLVELVGKVV